MFKGAIIGMLEDFIVNAYVKMCNGKEMWGTLETKCRVSNTDQFDD
jgi:hypothetical protein